MDADDGLCEADAFDFSSACELDERGVCESLDACAQRAQVGAESQWEHGDAAVGEIGGVAALAGFAIQRRAGADVVCDIGDVNAEPPAVVRFLHADGVIMIFRIIGVNRGDELIAAVFAFCDFSGGDFIGKGFRFAHDGGGEFDVEIVGADDGKHVHAVVGGSAEEFDDLAGRGDVDICPRLHFQNDLVTSARRTLQRWTAGADEKVERNAWVVGDQKGVSFHALEGADECIVCAGNDASDAGAVAADALALDGVAGERGGSFLHPRDEFVVAADEARAAAATVEK